MAMMWSPSTTRTGVVDGDQPVGVAVEGDAEIGTVLADRRGERRRVRSLRRHR